MTQQTAIDALVSGNQMTQSRQGVSVVNGKTIVNYNFNTLSGTLLANGATNTSFFAQDQQDNTVLAMQQFTNVANIEFQETNDANDSAIKFFNADLNSFTAYSAGPYDFFGQDIGNSIVVDKDYIGTDINTQDYRIILHEIGHSLGLDHPNGVGTEPGFNSDITVMSYNAGAYTAGHEAGGLMIYDIVAIQEIYGVNYDYNSGDNTYYIDDNGLNGSKYFTIWDGAGNDTIDISNVTQSGTFTIDLREGVDYATHTGNSHIWNAFGANIENATGRAQDDIIIGNDLDNVLKGEGGDDTLTGGIGSDTLNGGSGEDTTFYRNASAAVALNLKNGTGTAGDAQGDTFVSIENIDGSDYADTLEGSNVDNKIYGHVGNDWIDGFAGDDTLYGGSGVDQILGGDDNDDLYGGDDTDYLYGQSGSDDIFGEGGNDFLYGGTGANDYLDGGDGEDMAVYWHSQSGVVVSLLTGTGSAGDAAGDTLVNIENLDGSQFYDDVLEGDNNDNIIYGHGGNDTLIGLGGVDTLYGGSGEDKASYRSANSAVALNLKNGTGTAGDAQDDTLISIENIDGSDYGDTLEGSDIDNKIYGHVGNDWIDGFAGDDTLYGGVGVDQILGGNDNDDLYGGDDTDYLYGQNGSDDIFGEGGNDFLYGGTGANDYLDGGDGEDMAVYWHSNYGVTVSLQTGVGTAGDAAGDTLVNIENLDGSQFYDDVLEGDNNDNIIYGHGGNDTIKGLGGNDTIYGGSDSDIINGGIGKDTLYGQAGSDTFEFSSLQDSNINDADLIQDFEDGSDIIDFSGISEISQMNDLEISVDNGFTQIKDKDSDFAINLNGEFSLLSEDDFNF